MLQIIKRTAIAAIAAAAIAAPSAAYASIGFVPDSPTVSKPAAVTIRQSTGGQHATGAFDWADTGIGAAVAVVLIGAAVAMSRGRRVRTGGGGHARRVSTS